MIPENFLVKSFKPLRLTVNNIGPFQDGPVSFDFTDKQDLPCNFFLLMSKNGRGKTTLLEVMTVLFNMLACQEMDSFGHEDLDSGKNKSWAQLDIFIQAKYNGSEISAALSLVAGTFKTLPFHPDKDPYNAIELTARHFHGFRRRTSGRLERIEKSDEFVEDLVAAINLFKGEPPTGFEEETLSFPTMLYFSAYRDIKPIYGGQRAIIQPSDWGYQPLHCFIEEGKEWDRSLDNMLVWMKWLDDGRFERAVEIVNRRVFEESTKFLKDVRKQPPEAIMINDGSEHRLDRLSSGEKSLVQLFLQIGGHMTLNTIILIDELEVHLHPNMQHRLLRILKQLAIDNPGLTIISTTHSREILRAFAHEIEEKGLVKGGHIISEDFSVSE